MARRAGRRAKARAGETFETVETGGPGRPLPEDDGYRLATWHAMDGLRLAARDYGDPLSPWLPVVCLPALTRNARDFHELALFLSAHRHRPRRVVAFDYRGRGRSAYDSDHTRYTPMVELADVLDGMAMVGLHRAAVVGTSRGGIIAMLMGVVRPSALAAVVLNDIGPAIEPAGLARIKAYVATAPAPADWADAADLMRRLHGARFPALDDADWDAFARMTFRDDDGRPVRDFDPALAMSLAGIELDRPVPDMWAPFATLAGKPLLVLRGEHSDLLAEATVNAMAAVHPTMEAVTVAGQGHAPLLRQPALLQRIAAFLTAAEGPRPPADAVVPVQPVPYRAE